MCVCGALKISFDVLLSVFTRFSSRAADVHLRKEALVITPDGARRVGAACRHVFVPRIMICPPGTTQVDTFSAAGLSWLACEDLRLPGGGITLVPERGAAVHLPKSYEPYSPEPDDYYYLGLGKDKVLGARWDMLGDAVINECPTKTSTTKMCEPTWQRVERALPVMRYSFGNKQASGNAFMCSPYSPESGVRTFTGSRSASVDATFSDHADDCTDNG